DGIRADAKIFDRSIGGPAYVVHPAIMPASARAALGGVAQLVELGTDAVPADALLAWMRDGLGAATVVCEGGGVLVANLFAARAARLDFAPRTFTLRSARQSSPSRGCRLMCFVRLT